MEHDRLTTLLLLTQHFMLLSFMAVGGANVLLPEMHHIAVDTHHWMTSREFSELFALAQASPGPNMLFISLVGWKAAGIAGAFTSTIAMCAPSTVITLIVARYLDRFRTAAWRLALQKAVAPVTAGLIVSSALLLMRAADHSAWTWGLSVAVTALSLRFSFNPLWFIGAGALIGVAVL